MNSKRQKQKVARIFRKFTGIDFINAQRIAKIYVNRDVSFCDIKDGMPLEREQKTCGEPGCCWWSETSIIGPKNNLCLSDLSICEHFTQDRKRFVANNPDFPMDEFLRIMGRNNV